MELVVEVAGDEYELKLGAANAEILPVHEDEEDELFAAPRLAFHEEGDKPRGVDGEHDGPDRKEEVGAQEGHLPVSVEVVSSPEVVVAGPHLPVDRFQVSLEGHRAEVLGADVGHADDVVEEHLDHERVRGVDLVGPRHDEDVPADLV